MRWIFAASPSQVSLATEVGQVAHLAYRAEPESGLVRLRDAAPKGGLLYLYLPCYCSELCQQILYECRRCSLSGVVLSLPDHPDKTLQNQVRQLDTLLAQRRLALYLHVRYVTLSPHGRYLIPTTLSGGSLGRYLEGMTRQMDPKRLVCVLEPTARAFLPPTADSEGFILSPEELAQLRRRAKSHFSPDLCAYYLTYQTPEGRIRFVLYDDADSLGAKLAAAESAGISTAFTAWRWREMLAL